MKQYINQTELADTLGISRQTLHTWRKNGFLRENTHKTHDGDWYMDNTGVVWYNVNAINKIVKRLKERL